MNTRSALTWWDVAPASGISSGWRPGTVDKVFPHHGSHISESCAACVPCHVTEASTRSDGVSEIWHFRELACAWWEEVDADEFLQHMLIGWRTAGARGVHQSHVLSVDIPPVVRPPRKKGFVVLDGNICAVYSDWKTSTHLFGVGNVSVGNHVCLADCYQHPHCHQNLHAPCSRHRRLLLCLSRC